MLSVLAKGYGTWDGELEICEDGEKKKLPIVPPTDHPHKHGVTVSPRRCKSALGTRPVAPAYPPSTQHENTDGQILLPKTFCTRKGALFLFTSPSGSSLSLDDQPNKVKKKTTTQTWEIGKKFQTMERFAKSVLQFGEENYDKENASISDNPNTPMVLNFVRNLDDIPIDIHSQPGGDYEFYLEDLKSRATSARTSYRSRQGPDSELPVDEAEELQREMMKVFGDESETRTTSGISRHSKFGGGDAELITADAEKLAEQFMRPVSQMSVRINPDRPGSSTSSHHSYKVLSAAKLAASVKSLNYMSRPSPAPSVIDERYSIASPAISINAATRPQSGASRNFDIRSRPVSARSAQLSSGVKSRPGSGFQRFVSQPGPQSRPNSVASSSDMFEAGGKASTSTTPVPAPPSHTGTSSVMEIHSVRHNDGNSSEMDEDNHYKNLHESYNLHVPEHGSEVDIETVDSQSVSEFTPDRHVSSVHIRSLPSRRPSSAQSSQVVSNPTLHDGHLKYEDSTVASTYAYEEELDPDLLQEEDIFLPEDEASLQQDMLPPLNEGHIYDYSEDVGVLCYSNAPLTQYQSEDGQSFHLGNSLHGSSTDLQIGATVPAQLPQYQGLLTGTTNQATAVFSFDNTTAESADLGDIIIEDTAASVIPHTVESVRSSSSRRETPMPDTAVDTESVKPDSPAPNQVLTEGGLVKHTPTPPPTKSPTPWKQTSETSTPKTTSAPAVKPTVTPGVDVKTPVHKKTKAIEKKSKSSMKQVPRMMRTKSKQEDVPAEPPVKRELKEFTSENLISDTRAEIEKLFGKVPVKPAAKESAKKAVDVVGITKFIENKSTKEEKEQVLEEPEEVKEIMEGSVLSKEVEETGLSVEEMELAQKMLEDKLEHAEGRIKSAGSKRGGKDKNKQKEKERKKAEMEKERAALREQRKIDMQKRAEEARQLQEQIKAKEEEKRKKEEHEKMLHEEKEAELRALAAEEDEIRKQEEAARAQIAAARKAEREVREAKRKAELERRKQEAIEQREKQKQMAENARKKELDMLERIADAKALREKKEEMRLQQEWEEELAEKKLQEKLDDVELEMEAQEDQIEIIESDVEAEAMSSIVKEREEAEERRRELEREMMEYKQQQDLEVMRQVEEIQRLEEESRQRHLVEMERLRLEKERLDELKRKEEEAREQMRREMAQRQQELLKIRKRNLEKKSNLNNVRASQGVTRPWVFSYFVLWPRETYTRPMTAEDIKKKKKGKKKGKKGKKKGKKKR